MLGRDVTSNASKPSASSIAASAACRSARLSRLEVPGKRFESQPIAVGAESRHHAHREKRIAYRQTGVRKRRGVDQRAIGMALQTLDRLDQLAFMIRLNPGALDAQRARALFRSALDVRETRAAVNLRLALTQQIQIGAVQHGDVARH